MITADPLGRARRAALSVGGQSHQHAFLTGAKTLGLWLTGFGISQVTLRETPERQVETLVDISNVLLEMLSDLWILRPCQLQIDRCDLDSPFHRWFRP